MKRPAVLRDPTALDGSVGGLQTQCACDWYEFLADEAYFNDDVINHDRFKTYAERLKRSPYGYLYSKELEALIAQYVKD